MLLKEADTWLTSAPLPGVWDAFPTRRPVVPCKVHPVNLGPKLGDHWPDGCSAVSDLWGRVSLIRWKMLSWF